MKHRVAVEDVDFAWHLEFDLTPQSLLVEQLKHGQNFSEVMHGAQLLYNLILAEQWVNDHKSADYCDRVDEYRERLAEWWAIIEVRRSDMSKWDLPRFWQIVDK